MAPPPKGKLSKKSGLVASNNAKPTCPRCSKAVNDSVDETLKCEGCGSWVHSSCVGLDACFADTEFTLFDAFSALRASAFGGLLSFHCHQCNQDKLRLNSKITNLDTKVDSINVILSAVNTGLTEIKSSSSCISQDQCSPHGAGNEVSLNASRLDGIESKLDTLNAAVLGLEQMQNQISVLKSSIDCLTKDLDVHSKHINLPSFVDVVKKSLDSAKMSNSDISSFANVNEKEQLKKSVIIYGLSENGQDLASASAICELIDSSAVPREVCRLGRLPKSSGGNESVKKRPLQMFFSSAGVANNILANSRALKDSPDFKFIFLKKALSLEELKCLRNLYQVRDSLNNDNNDSSIRYAIYNGNLVRFIECIPLSNGRSGKGKLDRSYKFETSFLDH